MELKGSKTEANLITAYSGESQARNKYTFFASYAQKEGYEQIADIFRKTSDNEKEHAEIWFEYLRDNKKPTTVDSLLESAEAEHYEWAEMYKEFAQIAEEEGFKEIADKMQRVAKIEKDHEQRFRKLMQNLKEGKVFTRDGEVIWVCRNCGYIHVAKQAPNVCPVCKKPQAYFEIKPENY